MKLTIKRVPTVVSNYQEDAGERPRGGCGRNCLGHCCLPGEPPCPWVNLVSFSSRFRSESCCCNDCFVSGLLDAYVICKILLLFFGMQLFLMMFLWIKEISWFLQKAGIFTSKQLRLPLLEMISFTEEFYYFNCYIKLSPWVFFSLEQM